MQIEEARAGGWIWAEEPIVRRVQRPPPDLTPLAPAPTWMGNRVAFYGTLGMPSLPLREILREHVPAAQVISWRDGADPDIRVPLDRFEGTVGGLLEQLVALTGYAYRIEEQRLIWQALVTEFVELVLPPGDTEFEIGSNPQNAGGGQSYSQSGGGQGVSGGNVISGASSTSEFVKRTASFSALEDLMEVVEGLATNEDGLRGSVRLLRAGGGLIVRDRPAVVDAVKDLATVYNAAAGRQVLIDVKVLEVQRTDGMGVGIDWNLVHLTRDVRIEGLSSFAGQAGRLAGSPPPILKASRSEGINQPTGELLIEALRRQAKVTLVTEPRAITLVNQVAQIRISSRIVYLASSSITEEAGVGRDRSRVTLTPGTVESGFTLFFLPTVVEDQIFLQVSTNISTLDSIASFSTAGTSVQQPAVSGKTFTQITRLKDGDTMVMSGFRQIGGERRGSGNVVSMSERATNRAVETFILVTPIIV